MSLSDQNHKKYLFKLKWRTDLTYLGINKAILIKKSYIVYSKSQGRGNETENWPKRPVCTEHRAVNSASILWPLKEQMKICWY